MQKTPTKPDMVTVKADRRSMEERPHHERRVKSNESITKWTRLDFKSTNIMLCEEMLRESSSHLLEIFLRHPQMKDRDGDMLSSPIHR
jgi:hypothetical protein